MGPAPSQRALAARMAETTRDDGEGAGEGGVAAAGVRVLPGETRGGGADAAGGVGGDLVGGGDGQRISAEAGGAGEARGEDVGEEAGAALDHDAHAEDGGATDEAVFYIVQEAPSEGAVAEVMGPSGARPGSAACGFGDALGQALRYQGWR